jgi:hypothetical protein
MAQGVHKLWTYRVLHHASIRRCFAPRSPNVKSVHLQRRGAASVEMQKQSLEVLS